MILNHEQQEAINATEDKIVVVAPPGSGKTATMVEAIRKYSLENPEDKITAITFTKKAAAELQHKTMGLPVQTATIHSWSLKELNRLGMKYKFKVCILQDREIQELLLALCKKLGYYTIQQFTLFSFVMGNYNIDVSQSVKMKFQKVLSAYIEHKRKNRLYDFTDLPLYLFDMLNKYNETIDSIDALFVDEFQDVDEVQAQIFTMVKAKKHFYIGDPDQSIYIFRGATAENLNNLEGFAEKTLKVNYRSYQEIIDYSTMVRKYETLILNQPLESSWIECARTDDVGEVFVIDDIGDAHDAVTNKSKDAQDLIEYFMLKKPYILCRSNKLVKMIQEMGYTSVSTIHQAKGLEYPNVIVLAFDVDNEEELNIAYVACTRAQNGLMVSDPTVFTKLLPIVLYENKDEIIGGNLF